MESNLAQIVDIVSEKSAKYDENVKEILADKQILARILKYTLEEFEDIDITTIVANIDEPEVSKIRVEPGHTNTERIVKTANEDIISGEGKIYFDIRFSAYCGEEPIKVLVNIEAQRSSRASKLGYHLDNRILYYLGRMISAQKEVEFARSDYDRLKPVRSIWICMDAGNNDDSINRIRFRQETIYGNDTTLLNIDKVQGVIIRLRSNENVEKSKNTLVAMLEELLRKESADIKKKRLSEDYGLKMSIETERKVNEMCNLSQVLIEQGMEQGIEQGIEQGMERGIDLGKLTGKVVARYEDGMTIDEIAEKSHVSKEEVIDILKENALV